MKIVLDGTVTGLYRGDCECGFNWHGQGEQLPDHSYSALLPIAEAVVHKNMCHQEVWLNLEFTTRFQRWLEHYWQRMDSVNGLGQATMTR